jgi:predicted nucleic acid-binding protein
MTLYLDASALVAAQVATPARTLVLEALDADPVWCTSAVSLTEALAMVDRLLDEPLLRQDLEDELRLMWDRLWVIPVDQRCLDRATELARDQLLRLADALHLAAADRLPRPVQFVTLDPAQIPVALSLGFDVVSS